MARAPVRGPPRGPRGMRQRTRISSALIISGVTKDSSGTPLASCSVSLFLTSSGALFGRTTSDANGNYAFAVPADIAAYFVVAYKAGAPDVSGTTVNTLVGV